MDLKKFISRILLFILPLVVLTIVFESFLFYTGENLSGKAIIQAQINTPGTSIKYQRGILNQQFNIYKLEGIKATKPSILIIGSSRVMQFRDILFHPLEKEFYNAGGILQCADDLSMFSELVSSGEIPKPKIVIIGIDPWWFKKDYTPVKTWLNPKNIEDDAYSPASHIAAFNRIAKKILTINFSPSGDSYIGYYAKKNKEGFRKDGSLSISENLVHEFIKEPKYFDRENPPIIKRIQEFKTNRFSLSEIDSSKVSMILKSIQKLKAEGIEVVPYFPPFSQESFSALEKSEKLKPWWEFYKKHIAQEVIKITPLIIETTSTKELGLTDTYFLDGFHPGEVFVGYQVLALLEGLDKQSYLNKIDKGHLKSLLKAKTTLPITFQKEH